MKSKSKSTTKPVYNQQIEGAANTVNSTYGTQLPKVQAVTDTLGSFVPDLAKQFTNGDPNVTAAAGYNADVLGGKFLGAGNPQLQGMVDQTNNSVRNGVMASLGTRGLTNGSSYSDIVSRALADNETKLRYGDYSAERSRMDTAAGQAAGLASAQYLPLSIMESIAQSQMMPAQAASGLGSTMGGLLGSYTNQSQTSTPSIGMLIAQMAGNAASGWAQGGFK